MRVVRELVALGASEVSLLDLDGQVASDVLPQWMQSLVAVAGVPIRFDGRLHDGVRIERLSRAGLATLVVDQHAVFDSIVLRWALDLYGSALCVEVQVDSEYVFDAPPAAFGRELVDVIGDLHMRGARRVLYRDVTGAELPLQRLIDLGNRVPGLRYTYQGGAVRTVDDVAELAMIGAPMEAVLVDAARILAGDFDLAAANRASTPAAGP